MEFKYGGYTLDDEQLYLDRDGDLVFVRLNDGDLEWKCEEDSFWDDWGSGHVDDLRPVGDFLVKEKVYQIGKYYLMNNGGHSLFRRLDGIEVRDWTVYVDQKGDRWRGIEEVDPECLGRFE